MLEDFNLLVSTSRRNERKACSELWYLLREAGDISAEVQTTSVSGLIVSETSLDPVEAVYKLRSILLQRPWEFRYVLKVRPAQIVIPTDLDEISRKAGELAEISILPDESFRITIDKRRTDMRSSDIITRVADKITRRVNLEKPDKVVLIEVVGLKTGISIVPPNAIFSVERERRFL